MVILLDGGPSDKSGSGIDKFGLENFGSLSRVGLVREDHLQIGRQPDDPLAVEWLNKDLILNIFLEADHRVRIGLGMRETYDLECFISVCPSSPEKSKFEVHSLTHEGMLHKCLNSPDAPLNALKLAF